MADFDDYGKVSFGVGSFLSISLVVSYWSVVRISQI